MTHSACASDRAIVVVDDNPAILDAVAGMIEVVAGIPVRCFESPIAALHHFTLHPQACRLVISDFDMPEMNGAEMLRAMVAQRPELPAILFSGSTKEEIVASSLPAHCRFFSKAGGFSHLMEAVQLLAAA